MNFSHIQVCRLSVGKYASVDELRLCEIHIAEIAGKADEGDEDADKKGNPLLLPSELSTLIE